MSKEDGDDDLRQIPELPAPDVATIQMPPENDPAPIEALQLSSGLTASELKRESEKNEHDRSENFKNHFERIAVIALYGIAGIFTVFGLIWFWHLTTPPVWHWLAADEVSRLQNFVTGGIIATVAGGHIKKRLG